MKKLSAFFDFLHKSFVFLLFIGMLTVAGVSLVALSPVPYEEYQEYVAKLNDYYEKKSANTVQTQGEVAGVSKRGERSFSGDDDSWNIADDFWKLQNKQDLEVENFLVQSDTKYLLVQEEDQVDLSFSTDLGELTQETERIRLVRLTNLNNSTEISKLCLLQCEGDMLGIGLVGSRNLEEITVETLPGEVVSGLSEDVDSIKAYAFNLKSKEVVDIRLYVNSELHSFSGGAVNDSARLNCHLSVVKNSVHPEAADLQVLP